MNAIPSTTTHFCRLFVTLPRLNRLVDLKPICRLASRLHVQWHNICVRWGPKSRPHESADLGAKHQRKHELQPQRCCLMSNYFYYCYYYGTEYLTGSWSNSLQPMLFDRSNFVLIDQTCPVKYPGLWGPDIWPVRGFDICPVMTGRTFDRSPPWTALAGTYIRAPWCSQVPAKIVSLLPVAIQRAPSDGGSRATDDLSRIITDRQSAK